MYEYKSQALNNIKFTVPDSQSKPTRHAKSKKIQSGMRKKKKQTDKGVRTGRKEHYNCGYNSIADI